MTVDSRQLTVDSRQLTVDSDSIGKLRFVESHSSQKARRIGHPPLKERKDLKKLGCATRLDIEFDIDICDKMANKK